MIELIATAILIGSFIGIVVMIARKLPVLASLPLTSEPKPGLSLWQKAKEKIKLLPAPKGLSREKIIHRVLSKIKVLALRTESKTEKYLQRLRKKSRNQKEEKGDNYWQELRETKREHH